MYIYKNKKSSRDITDFLADLLEEHEFNLSESNIETFIEMCVKEEFPKIYFTDGVLNFDKILDDENHLEEIIMNYNIDKY